MTKTDRELEVEYDSFMSKGRYTSGRFSALLFCKAKIAELELSLKYSRNPVGGRINSRIHIEQLEKIKKLEAGNKNLEDWLVKQIDEIENRKIKDEGEESYQLGLEEVLDMIMKLKKRFGK